MPACTPICAASTSASPAQRPELRRARPGRPADFALIQPGASAPYPIRHHPVPFGSGRGGGFSNTGGCLDRLHRGMAPLCRNRGALLSLPLLLGLLLGRCSLRPGPSQEQRRAAVAAAFVERVVLPGYGQLAANAADLAASLEQLAAQPDAAHLQRARAVSVCSVSWSAPAATCRSCRPPSCMTAGPAIWRRRSSGMAVKPAAAATAISPWPPTSGPPCCAGCGSSEDAAASCSTLAAEDRGMGGPWPWHQVPPWGRVWRSGRSGRCGAISTWRLEAQQLFQS